MAGASATGHGGVSREGPRRRLEELGLGLPVPVASVGSYSPSHRHGELLWIAGHTSRAIDRPARAGIVGETISVAEAAKEAELAALNLLSAAAHAVGIDSLTALVQLRGYVRSGSEFAEHPAVIDGASRLFGAVFPDAPAHARAAVGVASLPGGACVELEAVFLVSE